jgi:phenylpropionate dioxygenase-like ring-hydroxylating dioxygenase large terminal subunit
MSDAATDSLGGWHPVAASDDVVDRPLAVRVLDDEVVLWRDSDGTLAAAADRCPHRGTRLSLGTVRIADGGARRLECPYHGWQFAADGRCAHIPADPGLVPTPAQGLDRRHAIERHGLVWLSLGGATEGGPFVVPELAADLPPRRVVCGPYDVDAAAPRVVENFLDISHFAFVHEGSLGERGQAGVPPYAVDLDAAGRPGVADVRVWQPRSMHSAAGGARVRYGYRVLAPFVALLEKAPEQQAEGRNAILLAACPLGETATRVWFTIATSDRASDEATIRAYQDRVFGEDRPILESQRPKPLPLAGGVEAHSTADRLSAAYRRYLLAHRIRVGTSGP